MTYIAVINALLVIRDSAENTQAQRCVAGFLVDTLD